jgi:hypothetical protein
MRSLNPAHSDAPMRLSSLFDFSVFGSPAQAGVLTELEGPEHKVDEGQVIDVEEPPQR